VAAAFAHLLFNICGISIFYPLRKVPVRMAEGLAKLARVNIAIPVSIIVVMYLGLPVLCVLFFR